MVNGRHRHVVVVLWDAVKAKARDFKFLSPAKKAGAFVLFVLDALYLSRQNYCLAPPYSSLSLDTYLRYLPLLPNISQSTDGPAVTY